MRHQFTDIDPRPALVRYDIGPQCSHIQFLGNHGGFSGARLWRVEWPDGAGCLRAIPGGGDTADRLALVHPLILLARRQGLAYVPRLYPTRTGDTWLTFEGRCWELAQWLPGVADFHARPTTARLEAACTALARLHEAWAASGCRVGPCPAVDRRLKVWQCWQQLVQSGWAPSVGSAGDDPVAPLIPRARALVDGWIARIPILLEPWRTRKLPLSPCVCDVWHDHLLFDGDQLTGLIDYGETKVDHPAVDLARMLGSLVGDAWDRWQQGLAAYRRVRPYSDEDLCLATVLDRSGVIVGLMNWLRWLYHDGRKFDNRAAVAARIRGLVERAEQW